MSRAQKVAVLVELWEQELLAAYGVSPRPVDKRDHARHLAGCSNTQLDNALTARDIDPDTGASTRVGYVW